MLLFPETSVVTDQCSPSANSTNLAKLLTCVRWKGLRRRLRCQTCFETNTLGEGVKGEGVKSTNETLTPTRCLAILWTAHPVSLHLWSLMPIVTVGTLQNGTFLQLDQLISSPPGTTTHARLFISNHNERGSIARVPHQCHNTMPLLGDKQFSP